LVDSRELRELKSVDASALAGSRDHFASCPRLADPSSAARTCHVAPWLLSEDIVPGATLALDMNVKRQLASRTMWRPVLIGDTEGCRLLSLQVRKWGDLERLRNQCGFAVGMLSRYLSGERKPNGPTRTLLEKKLGIPSTAWDEPAPLRAKKTRTARRILRRAPRLAAHVARRRR
jgi:hypothetical protein